MRNGEKHRAPKFRQLVTLSVDQGKIISPAVKLVAAFAETKHGRAGVKRKQIRAGNFVEGEFLHQRSVGAANGDGQRLRAKRDAEISDPNFLFTGELSAREIFPSPENQQARANVRAAVQLPVSRAAQVRCGWFASLTSLIFNSTGRPATMTGAFSFAETQQNDKMPMPNIWQHTLEKARRFFIRF